MVDEHLKCPICNTKPNYQKIKAIMAAKTTKGTKATVTIFALANELGCNDDVDDDL